MGCPNGSLRVDDARARGRAECLAPGAEHLGPTVRERAAPRSLALGPAPGIAHDQKLVVALNETMRLMQEIDAIIDQHGSCPDAFFRSTGDPS